MRNIVNAQSIIIDIRHQLSWQQRCLSNTSTVFLWVAWLLLWQPLMVSLGVLDEHNHNVVIQIANVILGVLENGFVAILVCALMLWLWSNFIPAQSVKYTQIKGITDYAKAFAIPADIIHRSRQNKVVTVHHDEFGRITLID